MRNGATAFPEQETQTFPPLQPHSGRTNREIAKRLAPSLEARDVDYCVTKIRSDGEFSSCSESQDWSCSLTAKAGWVNCIPMRPA